MAKVSKEDLQKAAEEWKEHHAIVAAVRRLLKLTGSPKDAKDAIDALVASDADWEEMKDDLE